MKYYDYTETNLLKKPNNYMYSEFRGEDFIKSYINSRNIDIQRFNSFLPKEELGQIDLYICESSSLLITEDLFSPIHNTIINLSYFKKNGQIDTENLLISLLGHMVSGVDDRNLKYWLDFLLQRFEVTKKVHELYEPKKQKKGVGSENNIRLYWLFSLALTSYFSKSSNIKYLSTLLKINDLICSLDDDYLKFIPKQSLVLLLTEETKKINLMLNKIKGV